MLPHNRIRIPIKKIMKNDLNFELFFSIVSHKINVKI